MEIRKATQDDIETLIAFRKNVQSGNGMNHNINIDDNLREYFTKSMTEDLFISWLAVEDGITAASCGMYFLQQLPSFSNPSGRIAYITIVYTLPEYRNRGFASQLLERAINEARGLGYIVIRLHSSVNAKGLYDKLGFKSVEGFMELRS